MTSDTDQTEPVSERAGRSGPSEQSERLRDLVVGARVVLWDFDGPVCRLFAGYSADRVAGELVDWLEGLGLKELLTQEEQVHPDPHVLLGAVNRRRHRSDLVADFEERLTREELRAVATAWPTAYADPLIRTWSALDVGLAITTNNSPRVVSEYLATRGLLDCFAPHIYGRTQELHLLKPDPYCLNRALSAMGVAPAQAPDGRRHHLRPDRRPPGRGALPGLRPQRAEGEGPPGRGRGDGRALPGAGAAAALGDGGTGTGPHLTGPRRSHTCSRVRHLVGRRGGVRRGSTGTAGATGVPFSHSCTSARVQGERKTVDVA
ncbi:beta-phosphoglucomutase-like phosphatase (HAD superfamily) [Streptomyces ambofaciens]